jgi:hypothetical protein
MAIGITGANNGYSRKVADERFIQTAGGTVTGNLTVTGTLSTTLLEALSANITVIDIKQYELSGFNVQGNATVQGSVSATGDITVNQRLNFAGDASGANNLFFRRNSSNNWTWGSNGVGEILGINGNFITIPQDVIFSRAGITIRNIGESVGATLLGEAADVLAQRRRSGTAAQESRIYSTYTNASNYERFFIKTNVGATSATQIGLSAAGTGQNRSLEFVTGGSTIMSIASSGNVGIGTGTPISKLHIQGAMAGGVDGADTVGLRLTNTNGGTWRISSGAGGINNGTFTIFQVGQPQFTGERFVITSAGNIGIGITNPTAKLDILDTTLAGSGSLSGSALNIDQTWNTTGTPTAIKLNVTDTASNAASLLMDLRVGGTRQLGVSKGGAIFWRTGNRNTSLVPIPNGQLEFRDGSTLMLRIGNPDVLPHVAIGTNLTFGWTNDLSFSRDAANTLAQRNGLNAQESRIYSTYTDASNYERFFIKTNVGATSATQIGLSAAGTGQNRNLEFVTGGATRMTVASDGNVGIGAAASASFKLRVAGGNDNSLIVDNDGSQYSSMRLQHNGLHKANLTFNNASNEVDLWSVSTGTTLSLGTSNTARLDITSTGNVGIGTKSPNEKLTVVGNISATGNINGTFTGVFQVHPTGPTVITGGAGRWLFNYFGTSRYSLTDGEGLRLHTSRGVHWSSVSNDSLGTIDTAITRLSSGRLQITSGTSGDYRDLNVRDLIASGHLAAATKAFIIPHQTKPDKQLQHGCLEGPENSVYIRGTTSESTIVLPDYWDWLVHEDSVTVTVTSVGKFQPLYVISQDNKKVVVGGVEDKYNYTIYGTRKDVPELKVELEK